MLRNKMGRRGVTLVEVLISMTILLIVFMGLIQASLLSIRHNLRNEVRDDGVRLASDIMTAARAAGFENLWNSTRTHVKQTRNLSTTFTVERTVQVMDPNNKQVRVRVIWMDVADWTTLTHSIISSVRRPTTP